LLLTWVGDRKVFSVDLTPTMISIAGLIGIGLATFLGPAGVDLQQFINEFVTNGDIWLGGISGVLIKLFGDRNISLNIDEQSLTE